MSERALSDPELRRLGLEALIERLGPVDALRFIENCAPGAGDYTRDRKRWLDKATIDEIVRDIRERRKSA